MKHETKYAAEVIKGLKPLLQVAIKTAEQHGLDEIRISRARANELLHMAIVAAKELECNATEPSHFSHLDAIHA